MKIGLAQISPRLGDVSANLDLHLEAIGRAAREKAELLIFPELSLSGYTVKDLTGDLALNPQKNPAFQKLAAASRKISLVVGFIEEKENGLFYNSAAFLSGGRILHIHRKVFLPTFGIFEEAKFFAQGKNFKTFQTPFGRAGMMICRDFLNVGAGYLLFAGGAELVIVVSAAPGRGMSERPGFSSSRMWKVMGEMTALFSTSFVFYCNRVGFEDGIAFAGGSFIFGPAGNLLAQAPETDETVLFQDIRLEDIRDARKKWTFRRDDKPEVILEALKRVVRSHED